MQNYPLNGVADALGVCTVTLPSRPTTVRWKLQFITVQSNSDSQSIATVYVNNQPIIATSKGNLDSASGDPPIPITGKDSFEIQWVDCTPEALCTAVVWYDDAVY